MGGKGAGGVWEGEREILTFFRIKSPSAVPGRWSVYPGGEERSREETGSQGVQAPHPAALAAVPTSPFIKSQICFCWSPSCPTVVGKGKGPSSPFGIAIWNSICSPTSPNPSLSETLFL